MRPVLRADTSRPEAGASVDVVIGDSVIDHSPDKVVTFREALRASDLGGRAIRGMAEAGVFRLDWALGGKGGTRLGLVPELLSSRTGAEPREMGVAGRPCHWSEHGRSKQYGRDLEGGEDGQIEPEICTARLPRVRRAAVPSTPSHTTLCRLATEPCTSMCLQDAVDP